MNQIEKIASYISQLIDSSKQKGQYERLSIIFNTNDKGKYELPNDRIIKYMDFELKNIGIAVEERKVLKFYLVELELLLIYKIEELYERQSLLVTNPYFTN